MAKAPKAAARRRRQPARLSPEALGECPKKAAKPPGSPPPGTTHKARSAWFQARASWPVREASIEALVLERARAHVTLDSPPAGAVWQFAGPSNIGGRMTAVVCDPNDANRIWAGAAGGGVWSSVDGGVTWRNLWDRQPSLNIGSLAIDPANPNTLYCATGEANLSADSYPGVGLYRSVDGGAHWQILAGARTAGIPTRIGALAVDPFDPNHLRLGGVSHDPSSSDGHFVSRDGGATWVRDRFAGTGRHRCHAVLFDPRTRGVIYTTIAFAGASNGVWKSMDGGATWRQLRSGMPPSPDLGRMSLALCASDPRVLYALADSMRDNRVLFVLRSADAGVTWRDVTGNHFDDERQMSYGNTIAVHPSNANHAICGGVDLHLTTDGGATWRKVTRWDADRGQADYAHADHHCLLMPSARPGFIYDMNDGGMDVSADGGVRWQNRSAGLATTMFYDLDVAQTDPRVLGGGCQDNGTNITTNGQADKFFEITGGDGGWMLIDPTSVGHLFTTYQHMGMYRFRAGAWAQISLPATTQERDAVWMMYLDFHPTDTETVYAGGLGVWRTRDDGRTWRRGPVLDGSAITAIEAAVGNARRIYAGTENGGVFRSMDGGTSWSADISGGLIPGVTITRIASHPTNADEVIVCVANFGGRHVFRSTNGGLTWRDIDGGRLPDVPHHALAIPTPAPGTLFVANDAGVFMTKDRGANWTNLTSNLPTSPVVDIVYHDASRTLYAATYGRSIWRLRI
jgi:photosystem II stability/assembly factor-like uncharacterized protein